MSYEARALKLIGGVVTIGAIGSLMMSFHSDAESKQDFANDPSLGTTEQTHHILRSIQRNPFEANAHAPKQGKEATPQEGKSSHVIRSAKRNRLQAEASQSAEHGKKPEHEEGKSGHVIRSVKRNRLQAEASLSSGHGKEADREAHESKHILRSVKRERLLEGASQSSGHEEKSKPKEGESTHILRSMQRNRPQAEASHASEDKVKGAHQEQARAKVEDTGTVLAFFGVVAIIGFALLAQDFVKKLLDMSGMSANLGIKEKM